jgi:hypothetical protein
MARRALCSKVAFACRRVADDDVEHDRFGGRRWIPLSSHRERDAVDVFRDCLDVVIGNLRERRHRRHARILTATVNNRQNELAVLIGEHQVRPQQVDTAHVAAAKVGAMA